MRLVALIVFVLSGFPIFQLQSQSYDLDFSLSTVDNPAKVTFTPYFHQSQADYMVANPGSTDIDNNKYLYVTTQVKKAYRGSAVEICYDAFSYERSNVRGVPFKIPAKNTTARSIRQGTPDTYPIQVRVSLPKPKQAGFYTVLYDMVVPARKSESYQCETFRFPLTADIPSGATIGVWIAVSSKEVIRFDRIRLLP